MPTTPFILFHVFCTSIALLSGYLAMFLKKGSGVHGAAGTVFFVSMLGMSLSGAYGGAFIRPIMINVVAGLLTFYLVTTGWWAARRRQSAMGLFDRAALLLVLAVGVAAFAFGFRSASGIPGPIYFIFGTGAFLSAASDIRMLRRGDLSGQLRIRRHLWRMGMALLIATVSFFPGQGRLFPKWLRETNLLLVPHILLIGSLVFWRVRMRVRKSKLQPQLEPVMAKAA